MAKKGGKSRDKGEKSGFTFAGIDIPAALKGSGVTVDNLTKHPLVAGLAAMALESLAGQIRAKTAAASVATPPEPAEPSKPAAAKKPAPRKAPAKKPAPKAPAKKPAAKAATAAKKPPTKKPVARKPAAAAPKSAT